MHVTDARSASPASSASSASRSTARANTSSVTRRGRADLARAALGSDLDHLTDDDRLLIRAATGEIITPGQAPHERPLSAFAMQIAVDRRSGTLPAGVPVSVGYLHRKRDLLIDLGVPSNPFTGPTFDRAVAHLDHRHGWPTD